MKTAAPPWEPRGGRELARSRRAARARRPGARAARARLADPALRRHAPQPAVRRPPGVPRAPERALHRPPEEVGLAAARPRAAGDLVRRALRAAGRALPARGLPQEEGAARAAEPDVFPFVFCRACSGRSSSSAWPGRRDRARRARLLLHVVLQRLARQPEPLPGRSGR